MLGTNKERWFKIINVQMNSKFYKAALMRRATRHVTRFETTRGQFESYYVYSNTKAFTLKGTIRKMSEPTKKGSCTENRP